MAGWCRTCNKDQRLMLFPDESVITLTKICNIGSMPENVLAGKLNTISLYLVTLSNFKGRIICQIWNQIQFLILQGKKKINVGWCHSHNPPTYNTCCNVSLYPNQ